MRLIDVNTFEMKEFHGVDVPPYAILSHTWEEGEVTFQDWQNLPLARAKQGFAKIQATCEQAQSWNVQYAWVDTCCIDKSSSAELSEAINSMFAWYQASVVCFVYLADIPPPLFDIDLLEDVSVGKLKHHLKDSRWFTRGWTLQELLAPTLLVAFYSDWSLIGSRHHLTPVLSAITGIPFAILRDTVKLTDVSVSQRMSWAANRETTRVEDMAYCLLGIFDINMPLLYGEGQKAFRRLQEEIIKNSTDQTIFCWSWDRSVVPKNWAGFLAPSVKVFAQSGDYVVHYFSGEGQRPYATTNAGIQIELQNIVGWECWFVLLDVRATNRDKERVAIPVTCAGPRQNKRGISVFRGSFPERLLLIPDSWVSPPVKLDLFLMHAWGGSMHLPRQSLTTMGAHQAGIILLFPRALVPGKITPLETTQVLQGFVLAPKVYKNSEFGVEIEPVTVAVLLDLRYGLVVYTIKVEWYGVLNGRVDVQVGPGQFIESSDLKLQYDPYVGFYAPYLDERSRVVLVMLQIRGDAQQNNADPPKPLVYEDKYGFFGGKV